ncbi:hypothetical protein M3Y99_00314500 [Aphelenchoides fujianensis]|nr:hypothetical protein M3Y99_00314500 [Aphelenchoides fujianensis]
MRRRNAVCVALSLLSLVSISHAALISSPFDNFRIECPQNAGAQRLSIRMVESQGMKRQDTVFAISCTNVNELYPWNGIPQDLAELERENCRYSESFDPIMDRSTNFSCGPREYVASVVRLFGTKIQIGCCKLRTRDETNCVEQRFGKPFGVNIRSEIE